MARKQSATNYPVGDFLIKLKNASMAGNKEVKIATSKKIAAIADALKRLGFLDTVKKEKEEVVVTLAFKSKKPLLMDIKLMSKPGLRIYMGTAEIDAKKGPSILLLTTPIGVLSSREAVKKRTGGEAIAEIL